MSNERKMYLKTKIIILIAVIAWGSSLVWVRSTTQEACSRIAYNNAYDAYDLGKREARSDIARSPYVTDSIWSTEYISFEVKDTYFARGNDLRRNLEKLVDSEGFKYHCSSSPCVYIEIDGSDLAVKVNISIRRTTCFNVTDYLFSDLDKHVKDIVNLYSEQKAFLPKTSYDEVEKWVDLRCKAICAKIKERNVTVLEKLKEHSKNEGRSWFKDNEYRYKYL